MVNIPQNIQIIKQKIKTVCEKINRNENEIEIVAATKYVSIDKIKEAINCGIRNFGENYYQEAKLKIDALQSYDIKWHFIGILQKNKVKHVIKYFNLIHSVDNIELLQEINKRAQNYNKIQDVLLQVRTDMQDKTGINSDEVLEFIKMIENLDNIMIRGLMTIAPIVERKEEARPYFRCVKELSEEIKKLNIKNVRMDYLSMGMTQDYEVAIEEGANMIRIGTAIFGERR